MNNIPLIKLSHVSKYYKTETSVAEGMRDISLEFYNNEFVAITGESGSGKTTLLNVISGLDSYEDGELYYNGLETSHYTVKDFETFRAQNIAFVFQNYNVIDSYTVYENVVIALEAQNYPQDQIKERAETLIEHVGLMSHRNQRTAKLSGGQKQRVVIARALAKDAPIILADEPTGNLDTQSSDEILTLLKEISKDRLVILVSHNLAEVEKFATRKVIMEDGSIKNDVTITKTEVTKSNITDTFSKSSSLKKSFKISLRNILSTPKRTVFTFILFSIMIFATIFFYSSLVVNSISSITGGLNDVYASIALVSKDDEKFSMTDLDELNKNKKVSAFFDIELNYFSVEIKNDEYTDFIFHDLSLVSEIQNFKLEEGRFPTSDNEVIIKKTRYSWNRDTYTINDIIKVFDVDFKVVGIIDNTEYQADHKLYIKDSFIYSNDLKIKEQAKAFVKKDNDFTIIGVNSLDRREIELVKDKIDKDKYQIIDSHLRTEEDLKILVTFLKLIFWGLLLLILQVLFLVLYQIQKNVMEARKKDFSVYRSIGITEAEVSFMILYEQLIIAISAALFIIISIMLLGLKVPFFYNITRNLTFSNYLLVVLIFGLFSIRLGRKFNKKIFGLTVIEALKEED